MLIPIEMSRSNFQALWLVTEGGSTWVSLLNNSGRLVTLLWHIVQAPCHPPGVLHMNYKQSSVNLILLYGINLQVLYMEKIIGFSQILCYFVQCISWDKAVIYLLYYWQTCMYSTVCVLTWSYSSRTTVKPAYTLLFKYLLPPAHLTAIPELDQNHWNAFRTKPIS